MMIGSIDGPMANLMESTSRKQDMSDVKGDRKKAIGDLDGTLWETRHKDCCRYSDDTKWRNGFKKQELTKSTRLPVASGSTFGVAMMRTLAIFMLFYKCEEALAWSPRVNNVSNHAKSIVRPVRARSSPRSVSAPWTSSTKDSMTRLNLAMDILPSTATASLLDIGKDAAEALAGPFFGASLFPYLAFLYFLSRDENNCPKGVTVGFATCLLFVFLTIPAAITAQVQYGVSLADSDWLHGSAESLLTLTNLVTVIAFRQALNAKEKGTGMPASATSWAPMIWLVVVLTLVAGVTAAVPAFSGATVHTPYLGGFMDLPFSLESIGAHPEPENALTVACWIIHVSSLVEFLVAMGFAWRWADVVDNPTWKGLTWGLLPLHSSGITACTYHLFFNRISILVPLQALLTCIGNTTAAIASYRIARSNGWNPPALGGDAVTLLDTVTNTGAVSEEVQQFEESASLVGFEDLGEALAGDNDYSFLIKLFVGCAVASYTIKYGEVFFQFPNDANVYLGFAVIMVPSALNAFKWYKRSLDPQFEGWF